MLRPVLRQDRPLEVVGSGTPERAAPGVILATGRADAERLAASWDDVPSTSGGIGGSAWTAAWLSVWGDDHTLAVGQYGTAGSAPQAVVPLVRRRRRPWWLETLGVRELAEPTDVRAADHAALKAVVARLLRSGRALRSKRLPAQSPLPAMVRELVGGRAVVLARPVAGTPTIALDSSWEDPASKMSSRWRGSFRTAQRRAERLGVVDVRVEEPTVAEVLPLFDEFVAVESTGWKTSAGTALAAQPKMQAFFRRYCLLAAERGQLRFAFLRIDGRPAAVQLAIEQDGRYSLLKIGFDEEFARCSPGNLLMLHAVQTAAERGLTSFEFLGIEEAWTELWTRDVRECIELHVYPMSLWGVLAMGDMATELVGRAVGRGVRAIRSRRRRT